MWQYIMKTNVKRLELFKYGLSAISSLQNYYYYYQNISEAERQRNDHSYCQLLDHNETTEFVIQVAEIVNKMHVEGYIMEK